MNPRGLLIGYAEDEVKPVVSDFDTFTVGTVGVEYDELTAEQVKLVQWSLKHAEEVLAERKSLGWNSRWLNVLKQEAQKGFHPDLPKYGFGDPTSYDLIAGAVNSTKSCGAVRHGAECFNFYFPQELDEEYLVVWSGFPDKPWDYMTEPQLRKFLLDRAKKGHYSFPLNPVWSIRDIGWYEVFTAMR